MSPLPRWMPMTREQLYADLQSIWAKRKKTIIFVTHNVREAVCLGDRVVLFSPIQAGFASSSVIDLPRPRDVNSVELAGQATQITRALKQHTASDRLRMKRSLVAFLFFASLIALWQILVHAQIWSPVLLPPPLGCGKLPWAGSFRWLIA